MFYCGFATGQLLDERRTNWDGDGPRPIKWAVWYPTAQVPTEADAAKDTRRLFLLGDVIEDAPLARGDAKWPVVVLSHGTGGTAEGMGWLAYVLATSGYIVIAPNHHGNTGHEAYRPEGFLCWWERATDMSRLLDHMSEDDRFGPFMDANRASAVGFSLGGYAVLSLLGARTSVERFQLWARDKGAIGRGTEEFPDVAERLPELLESSSVFRRSFDQQSGDFSDARICKAVAIAPAPPVRAFSKESLLGIAKPVTIITGGADIVAPAGDCGGWLAEVNPSFQHISAGDAVGHYAFLGLPSRLGMRVAPKLFVDNEGVDRARVHQQTAKSILTALGPGA